MDEGRGEFGFSNPRDLWKESEMPLGLLRAIEHSGSRLEGFRDAHAAGPGGLI